MTAALAYLALGYMGGVLLLGGLLLVARFPLVGAVVLSCAWPLTLVAMVVGVVVRMVEGE